MFKKIFKDKPTYNKVVNWFNTNEFITLVNGTELKDYEINKVINIQTEQGKIWAVLIVDDKVSYIVLNDEPIDDEAMDEEICKQASRNKNKSQLLKNMDMKGLEQMKNEYNKATSNLESNDKPIELIALDMVKEEIPMLNVEGEVMEWIDENLEDYDNNVQEIFTELLENGCQSGIVSKLIYYDETVEFYNNHEKQILDMLYDNFMIEDVETKEGIEELLEIFPSLEDMDIREDFYFTEATTKVRELLEHDYENFYDMDDEEREQLENDYLIDALAEVNPYALSDLDKNCLAWAIFEYKASELYDMYNDFLNDLSTQEI